MVVVGFKAGQEGKKKADQNAIINNSKLDKEKLGKEEYVWPVKRKRNHNK